MIRARALASFAAILFGGAWLVACVPPLPGGALDDGSGGAAGSGGTSAGAGGASGPGSGGKTGAGLGGASGASGAGLGGAPGPGITGAAGTGAGGSGGSPLLLVQAGMPLNIAVDSGYVYWGDSRMQAIMRVPVEGGPPMGLAPLPGGAAWVAVDSAGSVYWSTQTNIMKLASGAGPPTTLASDTVITQIVAGQDAVFWIAIDTAPLSDRVMKVGRNGGAPTVLASGQPHVNAIAVDATNVYWTCPVSGKVMKIGVSGGEPIELTASARINTGSASLIVDATSVYWIDDTRYVAKVSTAGGQPEPATVAPIPVTAVAVDASGVYVAEPMGTIYAASDANRRLRVLGKAGSGPVWTLAVDATSVYWFENSVASIFRASK